MLSKLLSSAIVGIDAYTVGVEVDIARGLPSYIIVGLPDTAVKESKGRIEAAIKNCGIEFPFERVTVNLAPAGIKKEGSAFDLPIAVGILHASGIIKNDHLEDYIILGELSLDGKIQPVNGVLSIAASAGSKGINRIIIPEQNANEAAVVKGIEVYPASNLFQIIEFLNNRLTIPVKEVDIVSTVDDVNDYPVDFLEVKGQFHVKRALEVAAAGGHNLIMIGPPGSGKSMLAQRIPSILPDMTFEEAIETTKVHSIMGMLNKNSALVAKRPFRAPHHTISDAGLVGGGHTPTPGEVSISHNGVLFLDELPEFKRNVLEVMRQPLEDGYVTISRASRTASFPSRFMFVSASNPCPCGYYGSSIKKCTCSIMQVKKYMSKLSGPLMDRIDIHIDVPAVNFRSLAKQKNGEKSECIKKRVTAARTKQLERFKKDGIYSNSQMTNRQIKKYCDICDNSQDMLETTIDKMGLSARAYNRILKVSRTIADLEGEEKILTEHVAEAIQYRNLDRSL